MMSEQRRYPRLLLSQPGTLEVRYQRVEGEVEHELVDVTINSAAPEGMGILIRRPSDAPIEPGTSVTLRFETETDEKLELPGSIVWSANRREPNHSSDFGVRLQLEAATGQARQAYAKWIVDRLRGSKVG